MLLSDLVLRLKRVLPVFTDKFNEATAEFSGSVTSKANGLLTLSLNAPSQTKRFTVGDKVQMIAPVVLNPITYAQDNGGDVLELTLQYDHDFSEGYQGELILAGAQATPLALPILEVPNRRTVIVDTTAASVALPNTNLVVYEYNRFKVEQEYTVASCTNQVTNITLPDAPLAVGQQVKTTLSLGTRVYSTSTLTKFIERYTQTELPALQGKTPSAGINKLGKRLTLAVVMEPATANKNRQDTTELTQNHGGAFERQLIMQNFTLAVFAPSQESNLGEQQVELCLGEVLFALCQTLLGYRPALFGNPKTTQLVSTPSLLEHGTFEHNDAFYVHFYRFQMAYEITVNATALGNLAKFGETVAARDVEYRFKNHNGVVVETLGVDLDDEPLE